MARENLKAARKDAGMTQQQVAEKLGISLRYYQFIEKGERTGDFEIWDELEEILGIHQRILRLELQEGCQGKHPGSASSC